MYASARINLEMRVYDFSCSVSQYVRTAHAQTLIFGKPDDVTGWSLRLKFIFCPVKMRTV